MELIYMWVEKFHNIRRKGFSFSSNFFVDFQNGTIKIFPNAVPEYEVFPPYITDITALVGKNGSGKSSILELIGEKERNKRRHKDPDDAWFILYWMEDNLYVIEEMYSDKSYRPSPRSLIKNMKLPCAVNTGLKNPSSLCCRYHANELCFEDFLQGPQQGKLQEAIQIYTPLGTGARYNRESVRRDHYTVQFYRHVFLESELGLLKKYEFLLACRKNPTLSCNQYDLNYSNVTINVGVENVNLDIEEREIINKKIGKISDFPLAFDEKIVKEAGKVKKRNWLLDPTTSALSPKTQCIIHFLKTIIISLSTSYLDGEIPTSDIRNDYGSYLRELLDKTCVMVEEKVNSEFESYALKEPLGTIFDLLSELDSHYFSAEKISFLQKDDISDEHVKSFFEFIDLLNSCQKKCVVPSFFSFDISPLSDGERQFIHLTSALFSALTNFKYPGIQHAVILLDEPDNRMHPETARMFISYLVSELKRFEGITFQLIIATHSPLLLSDIPCRSVILLEKDLQSGDCIVKKNATQSFASNIHTLLAEAFFMKYTVGGWAKQYIDGILQEIENFPQKVQDENRGTDNHVKNIDDEYEKIKQKISIIGEDIIRYRLEEKLKHVLNQYNADKRIKISILRKELEKLERELSDEIY